MDQFNKSYYSIWSSLKNFAPFLSFIYIQSWKYCFLETLRSLEEKNFDPQNPEEPKTGFLTFPKPREVKRVGNWKPYRRAWDACNGMTTVFFNHLAWINNTSSNYDWPLCCTRSQIWRIHFWNWWSHGVTQCESLTPINIQWELWPFSKFVTWPWGQLYIPILFYHMLTQIYFRNAKLLLNCDCINFMLEFIRI